MIGHVLPPIGLHLRWQVPVLLLASCGALSCPLDETDICMSWTEERIGKLTTMWEGGSTASQIADELGDLLLQSVLHSEIASETGAFDIDSVANCITEKLIRRHPHVFGEADANDSDAVLKQWDAIKQTEEGIVQSALKPRCIGCSNCVLACPFGVPKYVADFDQMMKCDMCTDRTSEGLTPMCASVCPSEALWYGTIEEFRELARGAGFSARRLWCDPQDYFAVHLLET